MDDQVPTPKLESVLPEEFRSNEEEPSCSNEKDPLLVIVSSGQRYNLIRQLETFAPDFVILYHSDLATLRLLEVSIVLITILYQRSLVDFQP